MFGDVVAGLAVAALGGLIHLHVRLAVIANDVRWIKEALSDHGLLPQPGWRKQRAEES